MRMPESIGTHIGFIFTHNRLYAEKILEPRHVNGSRFAFLMALHYEDGLSQERISRQLNYSKATGTNTVRSLERDGYVFREKDKEDGRIYRVYLTEKGRNTIPEITPILHEWNHILLSEFSDEEKDQLFHLLKKARESLEKYDEEQQ